MESVHPVQIERINKFLLLKKKTGLATEKIQIYLNLLKFFIDHVEKKGLDVENLPNPDSFVLKLQFEGLTPETEKEYLSLFIDFTKYCANNPVSIVESSLNEIKEEKIDHFFQKETKSRVGENTVNCPKCGYLQKQSEKCSHCGNFLYDKSKGRPLRSLKITSLPKKKNRFYFLIILLLVTLSFGWYFKIFKTESGEEFYFEGETYLTGVIVEKTSLEYYAMVMYEYSGGLSAIFPKWNRIGHSEMSWGSDHEDIFVKLKYLYKKIEKVEPLEPVSPLHEKLKDITENLLTELNEVKSFFKSGSATLKSGQRKGRLYNNSIIYFRQLSEATDVFNKAMKSLCRYNGVTCGF